MSDIYRKTIFTLEMLQKICHRAYENSKRKCNSSNYENQVRSRDRVRLEKLHTLIDLQTVAMQLCSNANLVEYFMNPSLIIEVAEKLPPKLRLHPIVVGFTRLYFKPFREDSRKM